MIKGIGVDIIEIGRIAQAMRGGEKFLPRNFTAAEIKYFGEKNNAPQTAAGNFAAKEAFAKALGTGFRGFGLADVEILRDNLGAPYILFRGERHSCHLSISHSENYAVATVVIEE